MKKQAKKSKTPGKKAKSSTKAKSRKTLAEGRKAMKLTVKAKAKKAGAKKAAKKASKKPVESRDAHHNMVMDQSREFMTEHGQRPKRRNARAAAPKKIERITKPEAVPIRQPQLHGEN